jgi:hypothetical protein
VNSVSHRSNAVIRPQHHLSGGCATLWFAEPMIPLILHEWYHPFIMLPTLGNTSIDINLIDKVYGIIPVCVTCVRLFYFSAPRLRSRGILHIRYDLKEAVFTLLHAFEVVHDLQEIAFTTSLAGCIAASEGPPTSPLSRMNRTVNSAPFSTRLTWSPRPVWLLATPSFYD